MATDFKLEERAYIKIAYITGTFSKWYSFTAEGPLPPTTQLQGYYH